MSSAGSRLAWMVARLFVDPWRDRKDRELERWAAQERSLKGSANPDAEAAVHRARADALRRELAALRARAESRTTRRKLPRGDH
jgi:hypothetical protein